MSRSNFSNGWFKNKNTQGVTGSAQFKIIQTIEKIHKHVYNYGIRDFLGYRPKILNIGSEEILQVNREKVYAALGQIKHNKSPGKNGILCEFFKTEGKDLS